MARVRSHPAQIPEDRLFQERFWVVERIAWVGYGLLLLLAILGLFGSGGVLSRGTVSAGDSWLDYPRFARWDTGDEISMRLAGETGERSVTLSFAFSDTFQVDDIQPTPRRVVAGPDGHTYTFSAEGGDPIRVRFAVTPRDPGFARFGVTLPDANALGAWTFVWP